MTRSAFHYRALTADGTEVAGEIKAADQADAASKIQARGLYPLEAREKASSSEPESVAIGIAPQPSAKIPVPRLRLEALRLLAPLLEARMTADRALTIAGETTGNTRAGRALLAMAHEVAGGATLSRAMEHRLAPFLPEDRAAAEAGEASASLGEVMTRLAARAEAEAQLAARIRSALVYPAIVMAVAAVAFIIMAQGVLPQFTAMFPALGKPVPAGMMLASALATGASGLIIATMAGLGLLALAAQFSPGVQRLFAGLKNALSWVLPGMRALKREAAAERAIGLLALLVRSRVALPEALMLAAQAAGLKPLEQALLRARQAVLSGGQVSAAFALEAALPRAVAEFARIGEETGSLDTSLDQAARMLASRLSERAERLQSVVTPMLTIAMGLVIGGLLYVMISAIMEVYGSLLT